MDQTRDDAPKRATIVAAFENNHNGKLRLAKRMVDVTIECGCDAIKLPVRSVEDSYTDETLQQAEYRYPELGNTYGAVLARLELSADALRELRDYCVGRISFIAAPYDLVSLEVLKNLNVDAYQLDPPLLCHQPLLEELGRLRKKMLVCAGMCTERELEAALRILQRCPVTLLHCVMKESLQLDQTALSYVPYFRRRFSCEIGYLGFEIGIHAALAAYTLGATTIEKKFTIDRDFPGPGHAQSLDRDELKALVHGLTALESSLKSYGPRQVLPVELDMFAEQGCSLVSARPLKAGTSIQPDMLKVKAASQGVGPHLISWLQGKRLLYDIPADAPITFGIVKL
jgi:N,N'-diacetyllegionaminate synthase